MNSDRYHPTRHWRRHPFWKAGVKLTKNPNAFDHGRYTRRFTTSFNDRAGAREAGELVANDVGARLIVTDVMHAAMMDGGPTIIQAGRALELLVDSEGGEQSPEETRVPSSGFHVAFSGAVDYGRLYGPDHRVGGVYVSVNEDTTMFLVTSILEKPERRPWPFDEDPSYFLTLVHRGETLEEGLRRAVADKGATTRCGWPAGEQMVMPFRDAARIDGWTAPFDAGAVNATAARAIRAAMRIADPSRAGLTVRHAMPDDVDQDILARLTMGGRRGEEAVRKVTGEKLLPIVHFDLVENGDR